MKQKVYSYLYGMLLGSVVCSSNVLACDAHEDGCLGCRDDELLVCVENFVMEVCNAGGGYDYCDKGRVRDDIERLILRNTGTHMSRARAMVRSARKYQHPSHAGSR